MKDDLLGIMTHRIGNPERFARHAQAALSAGFSGVVLFAPAGVSIKRKRIEGYLRTSGSGWAKSSCGYPSVAMDIGYYTDAATVRQAKRIKNLEAIRFTGYGMGNKWTIQRRLLASPLLRPHLLPTKPMESAADALAFAREHGAIMIKPINGKGGQGIMRLSCGDAGCTLQRNGRKDVSGTQTAIEAVLRRAVGRNRYLIQRWIDIRNDEGRVFDIRALVQKNGDGRWETTGVAVREGPANSITSNMKSGGSALAAEPYLRRLFERERSDDMMRSIGELSEHLPVHLEKAYGKRLAELGLDFAVDRSGRLWLLEANVKPGKSVIRHVYGDDAARRCFLLPFHYARLLANRGP
ncbi:YheC/YheD family protein [Paenibacillus flagellatus]|uniref:ATP-grasp domain-containing protein n=1 Tax=Paenibacillus flagellatus TaxID=2211139 RepID=A0A2V5K2P1_9BACL|nr:YheC/YheD family protein [Paenibacillus flagellatus]PYI53509.1 hypothetical protein DLM86_17225 [Paenibacillus flagellatus]